jgi:hypothetical protein
MTSLPQSVETLIKTAGPDIPDNYKRSLALYLIDKHGYDIESIKTDIITLSQDRQLFLKTAYDALDKFSFPTMLNQADIQTYREKYESDDWEPVTKDREILYYKNKKDKIKIMPSDFAKIYILSPSGARGGSRRRRRTAHRKRKSHRKSKRVHHTRKKHTRRHRHSRHRRHHRH